jgi:opine dehydrogenase
MRTTYTVLGAGNGGKAMAAHLALMGFPVTLYNRTFDHVSAIQKRGGIDLEYPESGDMALAE